MSPHEAPLIWVQQVEDRRSAGAGASGIVPIFSEAEAWVFLRRPAYKAVSAVIGGTSEKVNPRLVKLIRFRSVSDFLAQYNRFGNFLHGLALLPALALDAEIGLLLGQAKISLQDSLGALDHFASLQLLR